VTRCCNIDFNVMNDQFYLKEEIELFNQMTDSGYVSDLIACSFHMLAPCKQGTFQMSVD
jgi:hypothetical protein